MLIVKLNKYVKFYVAALLFFALSAKAAQSELNWTDHVQATAQDGFDAKGLWILGIGSVATLIAFNNDQGIHDSWTGHQKMSAETSRYGDLWGSGIPETLIFAGQIYYDPQNGIPSAEGFILGGLVTHSLKLITARERPDSTTRTAFPSGHTQAAFSIAASMTESYGWKVGLPFWFLGTFTGLSRIADNAHWLSDVVAGATLGAFFGRAGFKHHQDFRPVVLLNRGAIDGAALGLHLNW